MRHTFPLVLLVACCSAPAAPAPRPALVLAPSATAVPAKPDLDPSSISIAAARVPSGLAVDGDLGEWASLSGGPRPAEAGTRLRFALDARGAYLAAEVGAAAVDGLWLALFSYPARVPEPGEYEHAGGRPLECENDREGKPLAPAAVEECKQILVRYAADLIEHDRDFARVLRVDGTGVRVQSTDGALDPVEGAKVVWKAGANGAIVEASLPLSVLPRLAAAPLTQLDCAARPASAPAPTTKDKRESLTLPEAVSFEPYGELRASLFEWSNRDIGASITSLSYRASDPEHILTFGYARPQDHRQISPATEKIFDTKAALGDVSVGYTSVNWNNWLVVLRKGALLGFHYQAGVRKGLVERAGEVHALSYDEDYDWGGSMHRYARWAVHAVTADGSLRQLLPVHEGSDSRWDWREVAPFASSDFGRFGTRGWGVYEATVVDWSRVPFKGREVNYRWDQIRRTYLETDRQVALPPRAKARP